MITPELHQRWLEVSGQVSQADKLFEELGYTKIRNDDYVLEYKKIENCGDSVISFLKVSQEFTKRFLGEYGYIDMQELKAINKKCEELGWSDE